MASTQFKDYQEPAINAAWLNDVNRAAYTLTPGLRFAATVASIPGTGPIIEAATSVNLGTDTGSNAVTRVSRTFTGDVAGKPTSGYVNAIDLTRDYTFISNSSGWNNSLVDNEGRTGIFAHRTRMIHAGQGDLVANNVSARITSLPPVGATHWLAAPAAVIVNGTVIGAANGCYLNPYETVMTDTPNVGESYNVTAVGFVHNFIRNTAAGPKNPGVPGAGIGQVWAGERFQSKGAIACDSIISATGLWNSGVDLSMAALNFGANRAAIAMKANDRHYFNATATEIDDGSQFIRADWRATGGFLDYTVYDSSVSRWKTVVGGVESLQVSNTQVTVNQLNSSTNVLIGAGSRLFVAGTAVVGPRVTNYAAMTGVSNINTVYDVSTVTLPQLAARVAALQASLTSHGLIGA